MSQISNVLRVIAFDEQEPPSRILSRLDDVLRRLPRRPHGHRTGRPPGAPGR